MIERTIGLIEKLLIPFEKISGIRCGIINAGYNSQSERFDLIAHLEYDKYVQAFLIEYAGTVNQASVSLHLLQVSKTNAKTILIADYISPNYAEQLKHKGINYIDGVGNAYIADPPIYIEIRGNKPRKTPHQSRLFKTTGMKVIFALLSELSMVNESYREISKKSGVSLGSIDWIMKDLESSGYMLKVKQGKRILQKQEELLKRWVEAYPDQLRAKLLIEKVEHRHRDSVWWKEADVKGKMCYWSGEVSSALLTQYLKPENCCIYFSSEVNRFMVENNLVRNPEGNIELLEKFWNFTHPFESDGQAPPILIYADLIASRNNRNLEAAEIIYDRYIAEHIRKA